MTGREQASKGRLPARKGLSSFVVAVVLHLSLDHMAPVTRSAKRKAEMASELLPPQPPRKRPRPAPDQPGCAPLYAAQCSGPASSSVGTLSLNHAAPTFIVPPALPAPEAFTIDIGHGYFKPEHNLKGVKLVRIRDLVGVTARAMLDMPPRELGRGTFGTVLAGRQVYTQQEVAIKLLNAAAEMPSNQVCTWRACDPQNDCWETVCWDACSSLLRDRHCLGLFLARVLHFEECWKSGSQWSLHGPAVHCSSSTSYNTTDARHP